MAEFTRKLLREIFEGADMEVPPKDVLGKICDLHEAANNGMAETIKDLQGKLRGAATQESDKPDDKAKNSGDDWKTKYENEHNAFENFKKNQAAKETKAAKEAAVRAYFEGKKITGGNLNIAMRGAKDEISGIELDAEGKIKDTAALDALVGGEFAALVVTTQTRGAQVETPPANNGGGKLTRADIYKRDDHGRYIMSTEERQKALASNPDLMKG